MNMKPIKPIEPMSQSTLERLKNNYILQAWLVLVLAFCFGGALAGVHVTLSPTIEQNKLNETLQKIPELVLSESQKQQLESQNKSLAVKSHSIGVEKPGKKTFYSVYEARLPNGEAAGWVAKASGQGYADKIELLVGLDPDIRKITGIFVLDQKETPGLGNKIVTEKWRSQFENTPLDTPLEVVKSGKKHPTEIDAITGATISSRSVTNLINTTVKDIREPLLSMASGKEVK